MKRILVIMGRSISILFLLYLTLGGGLRDLLIGRIQSEAEDLFRRNEGVSEVRVMLLSGALGQASQETFRIRSEKHDAPVYGSMILTGSQLAAFMDLWREQIPHRSSASLCHSPPYAFRFYKDSQLVAETSVCWECGNFTLTPIPFIPMEIGFVSDTKEAKALLEFCDKLLPYQRPAKSKIEVNEDTEVR